MKYILLLLLLSFSSLDTAAESTRVDDPSKKVLKVGAFNYYPGIFRDTDDKIKGFNVDILNEIAIRENWKLDFIFGSWNEGLERIKNGELDLITSTAFTTERAEYLDYPKTGILTVFSEVYTRDTSNIESILSLEGKKIGLLKGDFNGLSLKKLLDSFKIKSKIIEYDSFEYIFVAIMIGEVDAGVVNNSYGIAKHHEYNLKSTGIVFNPFDIYFAVGKGKHKDVIAAIDRYLENWKKQEDSPYHKAIKRWSYQEVNIVRTIPVWYKTVLIVIAAFLIVSGLFIFLLRRQIRNATKKILSRDAEFRILVQSLDDIVYTLDLNQRHTGVYGKWLENFGLKSGHFIGKTPGEIFDKERALIHIEANKKALNGEEVVYEWVSANGGEDKIFQTKLSPIKDEKGKVTGLVGVGRDITYLKNAEGQLREEKKRMQMIIEGTPYLFFFTQDNKGDITYISPSVEKISGHTVEEWLSTRDWFTTSHKINAYARKQTQAHLNGEISDGPLFLEIEHRDKKKIMLEIYENPILIDGKVTGIQGVAHDVTEKKRAEIELIASKERAEQNEKIKSELLDKLNEAQRLAKIGSWELDLRTGKVWWSEEVYRIFELNPEEFIPGVEANSRYVHPDDTDAYHEEFRRAIREKSEFNYDLRIISANGNLKYCNSRAHLVLDNSGEPVSVFGTFSDISERKKAREDLMKLLRAVEQSPVSIVITDLTGKIEYVNNKTVETTGYLLEELIGSNLRVLQSSETSHEEYKNLWETISSGRDWSGKFQNKKKNGELYWEYVQVSPVKDPDGKFSHYLAIKENITEKVEVESELERYRNHLEYLVLERTEEIDNINKKLLEEIELKNEAERLLMESLNKEKELSLLKSRFISTASHEFRTPLSSVLTSTELIQRYKSKWSEEKVNEHFERIKNSVAYLTNLMDDVLAVNRAEIGKVIFSPVQLDLYELCGKVINELNIREIEIIEFVFEYSAGRKIFNLDSKQSELILHNLLSNAVKYSVSGGKVELLVGADDDNIEIKIKDEGIGIPQSDLPRIFEPFHRSDNISNIKGTGLGLSIVKHAVDLHGGTIRYDSKEGEGTEVTVTIPVR